MVQDLCKYGIKKTANELQFQDSWAVQKKKTLESDCFEYFLQLLPSMVELINFGRHPSMPPKQSH